MTKLKNDRGLAVTKFCLAMEEHRRTDVGRVRSAKEFVAHFFPYDATQAKDSLFLHIPNDIRGPILSQWGIRGAKASVRDDDEKVATVVHDALMAGDIDETTFEDGIAPRVLIDWIALPDWWTFWRTGKLNGIAIQTALATARELGLFDDTWFLGTIEGRSGKLRGTDILCDTLSKEQLIGWIRRIHESGDGSPAGLIAALGWNTVLTKTAQEALLFVLDALADKTGLTDDDAAGTHPPDALAPTEAEAVRRRAEGERPRKAPVKDSGLPVAIPEIPAVDAVLDDELDEPPSIPSVQERSVWAAMQPEESPKLAEAREAMIATLFGTGAAEDTKPTPATLPQPPRPKPNPRAR